MELGPPVSFNRGLDRGEHSLSSATKNTTNALPILVNRHMGAFGGPEAGEFGQRTVSMSSSPDNR